MDDRERKHVNVEDNQEYFVPDEENKETMGRVGEKGGEASAQGEKNYDFGESATGDLDSDFQVDGGARVSDNEDDEF